MRLAVAMALLASGGCALINAASGGGSTDAAIVADAPAAIDAPVGPDADLVCSCNGDTLSCPGQLDQTCELGCTATNGSHCMQIVPSNGVSLTELSMVTAAFDTTSALTSGASHDYEIDTDNGFILDYGDNGYPTATPTVVRTAGTGAISGIVFTQISSSLSVIAVHELGVAPNSTVYVVGGHALAILSGSDVTIDGDLELRGGCYDLQGTYHAACAGPGGGAGGTSAGAATGCGAGGAGSSSDTTGGGGGAMGGAGAAGGDFGFPGGAGGPIAACAPDELVPLVGGSGGGVGGGGGGGAGGGGGGAIQITSLHSIWLTAQTGALPDQIVAGGAGGGGTPVTNSGGGGGGAGGAILLEAPTIILHGTLAANGGGGGGGSVTTGADGQNGTTSVVQAAGGTGSGTGGNTGRGGLGGSADGPASQGNAGAPGTGGGGGGVGRIRINNDGNPVDTSGTTFSPSPTFGTIVSQ